MTGKPQQKIMGREDDKATSITTFVGTGDHHDSKYHKLGRTAFFGRHQKEQQTSSSACHYSLHFYPSASMEYDIKTNRPKYVAFLIATVLIALGVIFLTYIQNMHKRHSKVHAVATKASSVVASLFPSMVRDRIMEDTLQQEQSPRKTKKARRRNKLENIDSMADVGTMTILGDSGTSIEESSRRHDTMTKSTNKTKKTSYAMVESATGSGSNVYKTKPIADLFPEATVLFADIVGFTAWSSTREPCQVFDLLETIYHCFDELAKRRHVFKIETIGDCYVAVTGLPNPRKDHAILACKFAKDCLYAMDIVTKKLEVTLGPDTSDLSIRVGLHSGPVTAGVLRGERSRFQLFGDTVNTAARMESNGKPGRIHISQETANYLVAGEKRDWFIHRNDKVVAKGKGELQTFWLDTIAMEVTGANKGHKGELCSYLVSNEQDNDKEPSHPTLQAAMEIERHNHHNDDPSHGLLTEREQRLIDWTVEQLLRLLKQIVAKRAQSINDSPVGIIPEAKASQEEILVFNEVQEVISLPIVEKGNPGVRKNIDPSSVQLHPDVTWQLFDYVTSISTLYRNNPFHNFEHATHVTLSVTKMLSRIVAPGTNSYHDEFQDGTETPSAAEDGYGIATDPLTQFAVVFSALIHDVDHEGVSNAQLVKENSPIARVYKNQSVAEQNSVNIAWDILMDPAFSDLRSCIYSSEEEFIRFRQMVVNSVMATDIVDKDLKALRNARWEKAFQKKHNENITKEDIDRKATIVIEHLIQASDVSHTMQHWHVYRKWNAKLYRELYTAYLKGRMETDPTEFWYKGELGFFDFYIIPLAKKLRDCGVFGVSCDEYLSYALQNKAEWEKNGMDVVAELRESVRDLDECFAKKENGTADCKK